MPDLTSMKNIGAEMARKLAEAGIRTPEELAEAGSKNALHSQSRVLLAPGGGKSG